MKQADADQETENYVSKGERALDLGKPQLAAKYLSKALVLSPTSLDAHFYMALAKMRLGLFPEAERHAKIVLARNPSEPHANLNLGVIKHKQGNSRSAITLYKKEIAINPRSLQAYYNLGQTYYDRSRWKLALSCLLKCYRRGFHAEHLEEDVASAARQSQNLRVEREVYHKELRKNREDHWALNNLGATYIDTGRWKKARDYLAAAEASLGSKQSRDATAWRQLIGRNRARLPPSSSGRG